MICSVCYQSSDGVRCAFCTLIAPSQPSDEAVLASKDLRLVAYIIDGFLVQVVCLIPWVTAVFLVAYFTGSWAFLDLYHADCRKGPVHRLPGAVALALCLGVWIVLDIGWRSAFECSSLRGTPGKRLLGLTVRKAGGRDLSHLESVLRNLIRSLPSTLLLLWIVLVRFGSSFGLGLLLVLTLSLALQAWLFIAFMRKNRSGWHDELVNAVVVQDSTVEPWRKVAGYTLMILIFTFALSFPYVIEDQRELEPEAFPAVLEQHEV